MYFERLTLQGDLNFTLDQRESEINLSNATFHPEFTCSVWPDLSTKSKTGFPMSYVAVPLFVFSELRREVIVRSVDISRIVDHHCLNFLFIIVGKYKFICASFREVQVTL
jgi:hypothetical protein